MKLLITCLLFTNTKESRLHKIPLSHTDSGFGGSFKNVQSYISATDETGKSFNLFTPLAPCETPGAIKGICDEFNRTVKNAIDNKLGKFTKKEILELCPSLSASTVERHLKKLTADNHIAKHSIGKNTFYVKCV